MDMNLRVFDDSAARPGPHGSGRDPGGYSFTNLPLSSSIYQTTSFLTRETVFDVGPDAIALARFLLRLDHTLLDPFFVSGKVRGTPRLSAESFLTLREAQPQKSVP
jgi:hypothetical protein